MATIICPVFWFMFRLFYKLKMFNGNELAPRAQFRSVTSIPLNLYFTLRTSYDTASSAFCAPASVSLKRIGYLTLALYKPQPATATLFPSHTHTFDRPSTPTTSHTFSRTPSFYETHAILRASSSPWASLTPSPATAAISSTAKLPGAKTKVHAFSSSKLLSNS
jgi:hypothetical protein